MYLVKHHLRIILSCSAAILICFSVVASGSLVAAETQINLVLHDTLPPALSVDTAKKNTITTSTSMMFLRGRVHNVNQLLVYIDGTYRSTTALSDGADTYSIAILLSAGTHTIRLVGIDAYDALQVQQTFTAVYTPSAQPVPPNESGGGVVVEPPSAENTSVSTPLLHVLTAPLRAIPHSVGRVLRTIGVIDSHQGTHAWRMPLRTIFILLGGIVLLYPETISRRKLVNKWHHHNLTLVVRCLGVLLILIPFLLIP